MRNQLIGTILSQLLKDYDSGSCDNLSPLENELLLLDLVSFKDKLLDKQDKVLTIEETSLYLNCTRLTLNKYVKEGKLIPTKHLGGVMEFKLKDIKDFIKKSRNK